MIMNEVNTENINKLVEIKRIKLLFKKLQHYNLKCLLSFIENFINLQDLRRNANILKFAEILIAILTNE